MKPGFSTASRVLVVFAVAVAAAIGSVGCSPTVVPTSGPRAATDPKDVVIYPKKPSRYEQLGPVEVPVGGDVRWDQYGDATPGFEKLKAAAAALGANGLLLAPASADAEMVVAKYRGTSYQVPLRRGTPNKVVAEAIYVPEQ